MKFIESKYFLKQLEQLSWKYNRIYEDFSEFKEIFNPQYSTHLWEWIYKERFKNSSIPIWKRWWFRFIVKVYWDKVVPLLVYSKNIQTNVSKDEINEALSNTIKELSK